MMEEEEYERVKKLSQKKTKPQDLLIASQMLLPLSYWSSWAEEQ